MKAVLAVHGTRGDVEPCAAVALELRRRGHEVRMAVPPNLIGFVESVGLSAVAYGPDSHTQLDEDVFRHFWRVQNPVNVLRPGAEYLTRGWAEMSTALVSLTEGADVIVSGQTYQGVVANVAEYQGIPMAAMHHFPHRVNGHIVPYVPGPLIRTTMRALYGMYWWMTKDAEDTQRRALGLPKTWRSSARRMIDDQALEIQAYDAVYFPGLADEWNNRRPFVGQLTLEQPTACDDEVASWIAAGTPPIYFGFGSMRVESPAATVAMIGDVCAQLGERALICAGVTDFGAAAHRDNVKVVREVNHATVFGSCRAVVHHGGAGTTAAGMRAGVPTLVLWIGAEQPAWALQVTTLKVGKARRLAGTSKKTLLKDLRAILAPDYVARAGQIAGRMTPAKVSVSTTADLLEDEVRRHHLVVAGSGGTTR